jgi:hypothetical protein
MKFNGTLLSQLDNAFILVDFSSSVVDASDEMLNGKINRSDFHHDSPITHYYDKVAGDVLKFSITISKSNGEMLTKSDVKKLTGWLLSPIEPKVCNFIPYEGAETPVYSDVDYIGNFTDFSYVEMSQFHKMGITFSFENISQYAFTKEKEYSITSTGAGGASLTIENSGTATGELVYPVIEVNPNADGVISIQNMSNSNIGALEMDVYKNDSFIISDRNMIRPDGSLYGFRNLHNLNWVALVDGENTIKLTGNCNIVIKTRFFENVGV